MRLVQNWQSVMKRAWSIRLLVVAGALSGIEATVMLLNGSDLLPGWLHILLAILTPFVIMGAFVARLMAQKSITAPKGNQNEPL